MIYTGTRGGAGVSASQAVINGLAECGGLYVPEDIPKIDFDVRELCCMEYTALAHRVLKPYFSDYDDAALKNSICAAYGGSSFDAANIAPLKRMGDLSFLELFHGKTFAFKDMALCLMPGLLTSAIRANGLGSEVVILVATSGDTGKAALEGFRDVPGTRVVVFYPEDGVSPLQKLQMITQEGGNLHVVGIQGNFDDAQSGVKRLFADAELNKNLLDNGCVLSSANSINIGRLFPQIVYYFYAYGQLIASGMRAGTCVNFVVPTGNFGNILAGWYAKRMGLPVGKLICASNENNVLYDFFQTGVYDINREFKRTSSPSMDILISSNFERLVYNLIQDTDRVRGLLSDLQINGCFSMDTSFEEFAGFYATETETFAAIKKVWDAYGYVIDPHTAVAYCAYEKYGSQQPTVILATASPYKFSRSVLSALGIECGDTAETELPGRLAEVKDERLPQSIARLSSMPVRHNKTVNPRDMRHALLSCLSM